VLNIPEDLPLWPAIIDLMRPDIHVLYQGQIGLLYTISVMTSAHGKQKYSCCKFLKEMDGVNPKKGFTA